MAHRPTAARPGVTSAGSTVERCPGICRGLRSSSTSTTGPARAARASCTGSARTEASGWTSSRRSSGWSSPGGPNMPVGLARTVSCKLRRRRLIEGGLPTEATVAQVLVSKYADHLPLYRQAQIYARQGINLDRSTLADWVGHAAWHLRPLHERLLMRLRQLPRLFADETTAPVLDPGRGRTKTGQLWAYAADDRPWGGLDPPVVAYVYAPDRKAERPIAHLEGFKGVLQVDGYAGYRKLAEGGDVRLAFCWSHVRRNFYELATPGPAPIASEALKHIAALYAVEKDIRGRGTDERRAARQQKSKPLVDAFEPWLRSKLALISQKSKLAEAIRYALSRWEGLTRFIDDGRIELDNNTVERSIRLIALNRKNALYAGSDGGAEHWATIASLIETCKLNDVDPLAYLTDVLTRIVNGHPNSDIDQLLPWAYRRQALKAVA